MNQQQEIVICNLPSKLGLYVIHLKRLDQVLSLVSRIFVGSLKSIGTLLIDVVKHQNLMFDFILLCIIQWIVH
jgi:hypothetical protein